MNIFGLGPAEIAIILFVLLLFFGKDRLPGLARSLGESFKEIKNGFNNQTTSDKTKSVYEKEQPVTAKKDAE